MKQKIRFLVFAIMAMLSINQMWGADIVSGTTYAVYDSPTGWSTNATASGTSSNFLYMFKGKYITTPEFCQNKITSVKVKCRKYSSPSAASTPISVIWVDSESGTSTTLGTVSPSGTSLADATFTLSTPTPTSNTKGYIKLQCLGAESTSATKCVGISHVTVYFTSGTCTSYKLTAVSNNNTWGTVSLSGTTITASPATGYYVASATSSSSEITPSVDGNTITCSGTLTENTTVTVNFAAKTSANAKLSQAGIETSISGFVGDSYDLPESSNQTCNSKVFVGWSTVQINTPGSKPASNFYVPGASVTLALNDVFYAVYADASGSGSDSWSKAELNSLTSSDVFVIVGTVNSNSYALHNDAASASPEAISVTIENNKITTTVSDVMKWNISGNATDGYTFYPNGSTTTWLHSNTTASSSSNTNIRVGAGATTIRKIWEPNGTTLRTKDSYTARYLNVYTTGPDWRGYTSNSTSTTISYYKFISGTTYSNYTTTCGPATYTASVAGGLENGSINWHHFWSLSLINYSIRQRSFLRIPPL